MGLLRKDCKSPGMGEGALKQPPCPNCSIPEETAGPSSAVGDEAEEEPAPGKKKRGHEYELVELLREDTKFQTETEERRAQENRERMDRLFGLLKRMANK
ncbi:hypothetical protein cypCar_00024024 [Cyprinus carpio]|nr:hypothetical protein cypCar_00024024 [Cyprinus carpio]